MRAWKLWGLATLLCTAMACDGGGIRISGRSNKCVLGVTDCGPGSVCVPTGSGTEGTCELVSVTPCENGGTYCAAAGEICYQNTCNNPENVPCENGGTLCAAGELCNPSTNTCAIPCVSDTECPAGQVCADGMCGVETPNGCDPACTGGQRCVDNVCRTPGPSRCNNNTDCPLSGQVCETNICVVPCGVSNGTWCPVGELCDPNTNACVIPCVNDTECPAGQVCADGMCGVETPGACNPPCTGTQICVNDVCRNPGGRLCNDDTDCTLPGQVCDTNANVCVVPCGVNGGTWCPVGELCDPNTNACVIPCVNDTECPTGQVCADGICGVETPDECDPPCTGTQICVNYVCRNPGGLLCNDDTDCTLPGQVCDTNANVCVVPCGVSNGTWCPVGELCDPNTNACVIPCANDTECPAGQVCADGICGVETPGACNPPCTGTQMCVNYVCQEPGGHPCTSDAECTLPGQVCDTNANVCVVPCGVNGGTWCPVGELCDPNTNACVIPCANDTECPTGQVCADGICGVETPDECDPPCTGTQICVNDVCRNPGGLPCNNDTDCTLPGQVCDTNANVCVVPCGVSNGTWCANTNEVCHNGNCSLPCAADSECPGEQICVNLFCREPGSICIFNDDCPNGQLCVNNLCREEDDPPACNPACVGEEACINGNCETTGPIACEADGDCPSGRVCADGICRIPDTDPNACDPTCTPEQVCVNGACLRRGPTRCINADDCLPEAFCVHGICRVPNNADDNRDMDCDGIPDWEENEKVYPNGEKTDPLNPDTDGDGILDGIEIGRQFSPDPLCADIFPVLPLPPTNKTDPTLRDTDCDGLSDGDEDTNHNGRFEPELEETDPTNPDTDGDGLWDGLELGVTEATAADPINCPNTPYDMCPASTTNPLNPDTDGDRMMDGLEDANRNGCGPNDINSPEPEDLSETDPNVPDNFDQVVLDACSVQNLVEVNTQRNLAAQLALGLPMGFANSYVDIQRGNTNGIMGFDSVRNVAFVAWKHTGVVTDINVLRTLANSQAVNLGGVATTVGSFDSWDASPPGNNNALSVTFSLSGNMSPAARVNAIANTLLGAGTGSLPAGGTSGGTQYIRAQYVLRGNGEVVVVMAVAPDNDNVNGTPGFFGLNDVAGGAALARYLDRTVVQCERSEARGGMVDFLFVVDDSGSMLSSQNQLAQAGAAMATSLNNSNLNWRVALVTSSYHTPGYSNSNIVRGFTSDVQQFQAWLRQDSTCSSNAGGTCSAGTGQPAWTAPAPTCGGTGNGQNGGCWIGTNGFAYEGMLGAARLAIRDMNNSAAAPRIQFRDDAEIVVIILSDAPDQTAALNISYPTQTYWEEIQHFIDFFQGINTVARTTSTTNPASSNPTPVLAIRPGVTIEVNAVYCPAGMNCGDDTVPAATPTRIQNVVEATGGVLSSIRGGNLAIQNTMREVVERAIGRAGLLTQKPLIGASLRVAIERPIGPTCNSADVRRSRQHGFDYDGIYQTVTFFGDCRPADQSHVAISYRAWEASDRNQLPCQYDAHFDANALDYCNGLRSCDFAEDACVCPTDCGGCAAGMHCVSTTRTCACVPD